VSPDPFVQEPGNPQSLNRYSYTLNNPVVYIDPSGYFFDKIFKWIGNLFKHVFQSIVNLFKKPQLLFATLAVGIVTGGVALYFAPAAFGTIGRYAFAGAVGGAAAGAVGAAMTGGNIWQGALIGFVGGAVGGAVAGHVSSSFAGTFGAEVSGKIIGSLTGAFVRGAAAGGLSTAFYGGNFFENMLIGAGTSFAVASGFAGAYLAYTKITERYRRGLAPMGNTYSAVKAVQDRSVPASPL
jgi:hypothetical protein